MQLVPRRQRFLFLQGPPGPFFADLARGLVAERHAVWRINLNGGDRGDWNRHERTLPDDCTTDYTGSAADWPRFFDHFVRTRRLTDLVLFGDCRPLHRIAHGLATMHGLRIHVFEEGYLRPDWVTLELGGVNGHSDLPGDPDWYVTQAAGLPPPSATLPAIPFSFRRRAREAVLYYTDTVMQRWRFRHYRSHRTGSQVVEGLGWLRRLMGLARARARANALLKRLPTLRFFVFPLQLNTDYQVRVHSPFVTVCAALDYIVDSFARAASADVTLVVKLHPLDNGLIDWRRVTAAAARRFGVAGRVFLLEDGDIARVVARARGIVTINSTSGTFALGAGVPTIALGDAIYDLPGITHQGSLDAFWATPTPPDPRIWDAFTRVLRDRCLVRGGFLSDEGLALLVAGSVARLTATCGLPA